MTKKEMKDKFVSSPESRAIQNILSMVDFHGLTEDLRSRLIGAFSVAVRTLERDFPPFPFLDVFIFKICEDDTGRFFVKAYPYKEYNRPFIVYADSISY